MTNTRRPSQPCPYYCCSDFNKFNEKDFDTEFDLKNRIHPIFRPSNVRGASKALSRNRALKLMYEPFQLASRFLAMDSVLLHILTLAKGDVYLEKMNENPEKQILRRGKKASIQETRADTELYYYPKSTHSFKNPNLQKDAKFILSQLANMVNLEIARYDYDDAVCEPLQGPLPEHLHQEFPNGCRSLITLSREMILDLAQFADSEDRSEKIDFRMVQFELAQTLCHELGHALTHAVFGSKTTSPAKNSSWLSDAGYDLQASIFGGIPTEPTTSTYPRRTS